MRWRSSSATARSTWATVSGADTLAAVQDAVHGGAAEPGLGRDVGDPRSAWRAGHETECVAASAVGNPVAVPSSPFTLAVCVEMVLRDLPLADRIRHVHDLGFAAEIWDWTAKDLDELAGLAESGVRFTSMTGYVDGELVDPHGAEALLASAARSIEASRRLGAPNLNLHGTGLDGDGLPVRPVEVVTGPMWVAAVETLAQVAELGEREGVVFTLENLNTEVDHPGHARSPGPRTPAPWSPRSAARTCG